MAARKLLETTPDNPSACLVEGRYRCFYEGDWESGLPLLAKADDMQLSELAERISNREEQRSFLRLGTLGMKPPKTTSYLRPVLRVLLFFTA